MHVTDRVFVKRDSKKNCVAIVADKKKGVVPDKFPGTVAIVDDKENNTLLHPGYRRYDGADDENFNYFVTRLLPTVTARFCDSSLH